MPRHISILFPGQGSQHIGMLDNLPTELVESYRALALEALSFDLIDLIRNGNEEDLNKTSITQPAILLTSLIHYKHLQNSISIKADLMCGHSLGEYSALVASNSIRLDDALKLVYQRGLLMERSLKGSMYAILNTDIDIINEFCMKVRDDKNMIVSTANINSPKQIVIAGENKAVEAVVSDLKNNGYKKCIKLNVAVASHCKLMEKASNEFKNLIDKVEINFPECNIIHNTTASETKNISDLKQNLVLHLVNPVLWSQSMNYINSLNSIVIECGPGKVLTGLAKSNGIKNIYTSSSENFFYDIKSAL
tara:strand:+ start:514 stop:1434 length:921 start_codon:yes stop_codon:yes gene_type:complete